MPSEGTSTAARAESGRRWEAWCQVAVALGLVVVAAYVAVTSVALIRRESLRIPYWDHWQEILPGDYLARPLSLHNEHRIFFGRLVFALDTWLARGSGTFALAFVVGSLVATAALVALAVPRGPGRGLRAASILGLALAFFLAAYSWEAFLWGFQASYVGVWPPAVGAFVALVRPNGGWRTVAIAGGCAIAATYSLASGLLVAPLLAAVAALLGRPRRHVAALAVLSCALAVSYLAGYESPDIHASPSASLARPVGMMRYVTAFLGAPFTWGFEKDRLVAAQILGSAGLAAWALVIVYFVQERRRISEELWVLPCISTFAVAWAVIVGMGRLNFGTEQALASRYGTTALAFWLGLCGFAWFVVSHARWRLGLAAAGMFLAALLASQQGVHSTFAAGMLSRLRGAETVLATGALDAEIVERISPDPGLVVRALPELRRRGLLAKEHRVAWLGRPLPVATAPADGPRCSGFLDAARPVVAYGAPAFRLEGWAYSAERGTGPSELVAIDESGVVVGLAEMGTQRPDVNAAVPAAGDAAVGFIGHLGHHAARSVKVRAVALFADTQPACILRGEMHLDHARAGALVKR